MFSSHLVPSQCFLSKNVTNKGLMSICTKLVVQMNAKVGGEPWGLKNPLQVGNHIIIIEIYVLIFIVLKQGLMVVGFDVHHGKGMKSFGAMCATTTKTLATYYSTIVEMHSGLEMCAEIGNALARKDFY
jgi:aubergine-like protein